MKYCFKKGVLVVSDQSTMEELHDLFEAMKLGEIVQDDLAQHHVNLPDKLAIDIGEDVRRRMMKVKDFSAESQENAMDDTMFYVHDSISEWLDEHAEPEIFRRLADIAGVEDASCAAYISSSPRELLEYIYSDEPARSAFEAYFANHPLV